MRKGKRALTTSKSSTISTLKQYYLLFLLPIILALAGLYFVFEASSIYAMSTTGDSFYFLKRQMIFLGVGIIFMIFISFLNYRKFTLLALPGMVTVLILLVAVLIPGIGSKINGARRWIDLGFFSLQPTEFAKMTTILYLASWFSVKEKKKFFSFLFLIGILIFLVMLQPDMGTSIIIFSISIILYYLAGKDLHYLIGLIPLSIAGAVGLILAAPYRLKRLTAFLEPHKHADGAAYHINQVLISLANGGFMGQGFGASRQKYLFLPEAHTDSIFAILGEETGFIGALILLFLYTILLYKLYELYNNVTDEMGRLLIGGIFAYFGMQMIGNMAGMTALMPMTGVPLPFISYGGSHLLTSFILMGVALSVARYLKKTPVEKNKKVKLKKISA